jgi:hypothetical protein
MRLVTLGITLILSAFPPRGHSGASSEGIATPAASVASPLEGNWQVTGDREHKQYPFLSIFIHANGKQVYAAGDSQTVCSNTGGTYGGGFHLAGQIEPDGSFTLRTPPLPLAQHLTIVGKVPPAGSSRWAGSYTFKSPIKSECVFDQTGTFTASPLPPLVGTFFGQVMRAYPFPVPSDASPDYLHKTPERLKLSMTVSQGEFVFRERKTGLSYTYLPLTGTIQIIGCPCFTHGTTVAEFENAIRGDLVQMKFKMDDESELWIDSYYTSPDAGLSFRSHVKGGKCAGLGFAGTLSQKYRDSARRPAVKGAKSLFTTASLHNKPLWTEEQREHASGRGGRKR